MLNGQHELRGKIGLPEPALERSQFATDGHAKKRWQHWTLRPSETEEKQPDSNNARKHDSQLVR